MTSFERRRLRRLDGAERLDDVPAELRLDRLRELVRLQRERDLVEPGTVWPFETVSLPPFCFEPGSCEYFFASAREVRRRSRAGCRSCRRAPSSRRGCARTSRCCGVPYSALVLVVVLLDLVVGHLRRPSSPSLKIFSETSCALDVVAHLRVGQALLLQRASGTRLRLPLKYCFLICVEPLVDLRVGDRRRRACRPSAGTPRAGRGTRRPGSSASRTPACRPSGTAACFCAVALLRLVEQLVELRLRDRLAVDHRDRVVRDASGRRRRTRRGRATSDASADDEESGLSQQKKRLRLPGARPE